MVLVVERQFIFSIRVSCVHCNMPRDSRTNCITCSTLSSYIGNIVIWRILPVRLACSICHCADTDLYHTFLLDLLAGGFHSNLHRDIYHPWLSNDSKSSRGVLFAFWCRNWPPQCLRSALRSRFAVGKRAIRSMDVLMLCVCVLIGRLRPLIQE